MVATGTNLCQVVTDGTLLRVRPSIMATSVMICGRLPRQRGNVMSPRTFVFDLSSRCAVLLPAGAAAQSPAAPVELVVCHDPAGGCRRKWMVQMHKFAFAVCAEATGKLHELKWELGLPTELSCCRTAVVGGYVAAADVKRVLAATLPMDRQLVTGSRVSTPGGHAIRTAALGAIDAVAG